MDDILKDGESFWKMMKESLRKSPAKLWYASDIVLSDKNPKMACERYPQKIKALRLFCSISMDEGSAQKFHKSNKTLGACTNKSQ